MAIRTVSVGDPVDIADLMLLDEGVSDVASLWNVSYTTGVNSTKPKSSDWSKIYNGALAVTNDASFKQYSTVSSYASHTLGNKLRADDINYLGGDPVYGASSLTSGLVTYIGQIHKPCDTDGCPYTPCSTYGGCTCNTSCNAICYGSYNFCHQHSACPIHSCECDATCVSYRCNCDTYCPDSPCDCDSHIPCTCDGSCDGDTPCICDGTCDGHRCAVDCPA